MLCRIATVIALVTLSGPVLAQDYIPLSMRTFSVTTIVNAPPWVTSLDDLEHLEVFREQKKIMSGKSEFFVWESVPHGEDFDDWSKLYGVTAQYPAEFSLDFYYNAFLKVYDENCEGILVQELSTTPDDFKLFVIACGRDKTNPETGDVGFFRMAMKNKTMVTNMYHVRVRPFETKGMTNLPMSILAMAYSLSVISKLQLVK